MTDERQAGLRAVIDEWYRDGRIRFSASLGGDSDSAAEFAAALAVAQVPAERLDVDRRAIEEVIEDRLDSHRQDIATCSCGQWTPYGPTGTTFRWHVARDIATHLIAVTDLTRALARHPLRSG